MPLSEPTPDASPASSDTPPRLPWRQRIGKRMTALGLVGALMVALPLVQVLRYHAEQADALAAARARLDPVARAVDVQRSLLVHRELAARVLAGQAQAEAERRLRQGEVDQRMGALGATLATGTWPRARDESDALREDWRVLSRAIGTRSVTPPESEHAHRLLVEQALQVIDLVGDIALPPGMPAPPLLRSSLELTRTLPRLAAQLAQLAPLDGGAGSGSAAARDLAAAEARLARTLGLLNATLARHPHAALGDAGSAAGALADRHLHLLTPGANASATARDAAAQRAISAQFALFDALHAEAAAALDRQQVQAEHALQRLVAALGGLAVLAALLAWSLLRHPGPTGPARHRRGAGDAAAGPVRDGAAGGSAPQQQAFRLLERLRDGRRRPPQGREAPSTLSGTL